jgi:hypothetical protein
VENVVKALLDAIRYLVSTDEGTIRTIGKYLKITDRPLLQTYYREVIVKQINRSLYPDIRAVEFVLDVERQTTPGMAKVKAEDFVDTRFLDKLKSADY